MLAVYRYSFSVQSSVPPYRLFGQDDGSDESVRRWTPVTLDQVITSGTLLDGQAPRINGNSGERVVVRCLRVYVDDPSYNPRQQRIFVSFRTGGGQKALYTVGAGAGIQETTTHVTHQHAERWKWCDKCTGAEAPDSLVVYSSPLSDETLHRYASLAIDGMESVDNVRDVRDDVVEVSNGSVLSQDCLELAELAARFGRKPPAQDQFTPIVSLGTSLVVPRPLFEHVAIILRQDALRNIAVVSPSEVELAFYIRTIGGRANMANLKLTVVLELVGLGRPASPPPTSKVVNV